MVFITEAMVYNPDFLDNGRYDRSTFKVADIPFVFLTLDQGPPLAGYARLETGSGFRRGRRGRTVGGQSECAERRTVSAMACVSLGDVREAGDVGRE